MNDMFKDTYVFEQNRENRSLYNTFCAAKQPLDSKSVLDLLSVGEIGQERMEKFVALYILTGCDYVSSFYRCSKKAFLETLIENVVFIYPDGNLLKTIYGEFQCIREEAWIRLVTAVYYTKFKKFFRHKSVGETFSLITNHSDSPEAQRMLSAVQYTPASNTALVA